jgi:hypothetical protein
MGLPAFAANTWTLDGVSFNTGVDGNGFSYLILASKGWKGAAPRRPDLTNRPDTNGAYRGPNYKGVRVVELTGIAQVETGVDRDALADKLEGLCGDPNQLFPLVRNELNRSLKLLVEVQATIDVRELPDGCTLSFGIQLLATEPRKFSTLTKTAQTGIAQAALDGVLWEGTPGNTGTEWNGPVAPITGLVWQASAGVSGKLTLDNAGGSPTPILFRIDGPSSGTLAQPSIVNTSTGETLTYAGSLNPGDVLLIDTGTGNVTLNGNSGAGQMSRADFFEIPAHSTIVVQFSGSLPAATALLTATWSDAY